MPVLGSSVRSFGPFCDLVKPDCSRLGTVFTSTISRARWGTKPAAIRKLTVLEYPSRCDCKPFPVPVATWYWVHSQIVCPASLSDPKDLYARRLVTKGQING